MFSCWLCMAFPYYVLRAATCCPFPDFLQSGDSRVRWLGEASEGGANFTSTVTFHGRVMRSMEIRGSEDVQDEEEWTRRRAFQRECLVEVTAGRYLCSHRQLKDDYENRYICMEFIIRNEVVIQLRESPVYRFQDPRLCSSDQLRLNDRPLVNSHEFFVASHPCPAALSGGYNVRMYDRRHGHGICDAFEGTTRLEGGCSSEDQGLVFRFRFPQCVPEGLGMDTEQRTFCVASWTDDQNTYCAVRHDSNPQQRAWCLRYHTLSATTGTFAAHLFRGLHCSRDPVPTGGIVLDMRLDLTPPVQTSLCVDDYEACTWENPCKDHWPDMQLACPRRCGLCNDTQPRLCTTPSWMRGTWRETDSNETLDVGVDGITLQESLGDRYQCVDWEAESEGVQSRGRHGAHSVDLMLIKASSNGCRHRYVCAQWRLIHRSMSFLLRYRFSRSQVWPFDGATPHGAPIGCHLFRFGDDTHPFPDRYTSRHFKTLVQSDATTTDCDFPNLNHVDEVLVTFGDLNQRGGHLRVFDDRGVVKMRLIVPACPGGLRVRQFACIGRTSHLDETFHVTYLEQTSEYHCWAFSSTLPTDFYLLSISDCAADAYDKIRSGQLQAIMSFHSAPSKPVSNSSMQTNPVYETATLKEPPNTLPIQNTVTRTTANMLSSDDENYKSVERNLSQANAVRAEGGKLPHSIGREEGTATPNAVLNDEFQNNRSNTQETYDIGNTTDDLGYSADGKALKTDDIAADHVENKSKIDELKNNVDYRRGERSQSEFNNGMKANETNDTSVNEDEITKETELDGATAETKIDHLDYGDSELIGGTERMSPADMEAFPSEDKSDKITKASIWSKDVRFSSKDDVDDDDDGWEGSSYQRADDKDSDDDVMTRVALTTAFNQNDGIDVIDDFSDQLLMLGLTANVTDAGDEIVTSVFHRIDDIIGNSSNDVKTMSTTLVSLKPMAITSSASAKTARDQSFLKAISIVYALYSWFLATIVFAYSDVDIYRAILENQYELL